MNPVWLFGQVLVRTQLEQLPHVGAVITSYSDVELGDCPMCAGYGDVAGGRRKCYDCDGTGEVQGKQFELNFPK